MFAESVPARRAALRALGLVLAALLVAGQLAALGHLGLVPHARCAEHGELVHAEPSARKQAAQSNAQNSVAPSEDEALAHEHCDHLGRVRESFCVAAARCVVVHDIETTPSVLEPPSAGAQSGLRAPLTVAPKQSPPSC